MVATARLLASLLGAMDKIIPLTRQGVESGSPFFGAAILSRSDLSVLTAASNNGHSSPTLHGEMNCINKFFQETFPDPKCRPDPRNDTIFFATHEPCSMCLSAIAWAGFSEFYYLFDYDDSRQAGFPDDMNMIKEVFQVHGSGARDEAQQRPL